MVVKRGYSKPGVRSESTQIGVYGNSYGGVTPSPYCQTPAIEICNPPCMEAHPG